jgi:hypothetical protein
LDYFWLLIFGHLPFSFDLMPSLKRSDRCYNMGPICHPLCTLKVSFLGLFFAPDIWSLSFFFRSHAASETWSKVLAHGTRMSSSMYNKVSFLGFFPPDFWSLAFFFRSYAAFEIE